MNLKNIIPISEARKKIFEIAEKVQKPDNFYGLTEHGRLKMVVMSANDFESWQETLEVYEQFPNLSENIARVDKDIESGEYKNYSSLEEVMGEYGFVVASKKEKYEISNKNRQRSPENIKKNSKKIPGKNS